MKNLIVIAGPTGCGESSVTKGVLTKIPQAERFITTTSREPRGAEKDGVDYNFINKNDFEKKIKENYFLEYTYIENRDTYYGTPRYQVEEKLEQEKIVIFNYDLVGAKTMKDSFPDRTRTIFIVPENLEQIRKQLLNRNPEMAQAELEKRLQNAQMELKDRDYYDHILVNRYGQLENTIEECYKLILS